MISVRASFSNIRLSEQFYMKLNPQIYYLNMDNVDGTYFNAALTFAIRNFPLSVSAMINQPFKTYIAAGNEFLWNVGLIYSFNKKYVEK